MNDWEEKMMIRDEGREEGREEGQLLLNKLNELNKLLIQDGRTEDILRGIEDSEYQKELFKEYGL